MVPKQSQTLVEVELQHIHTALHTSLHIGVCQLNTVARAATVFLQIVQKSAITATQVEHAASNRYQLRQGMQIDVVRHAWPPRKGASSAMRAKYERTTCI